MLAERHFQSVIKYEFCLRYRCAKIWHDIVVGHLRGVSTLRLTIGHQQNLGQFSLIVKSRRNQSWCDRRCRHNNYVFWNLFRSRQMSWPSFCLDETVLSISVNYPHPYSGYHYSTQSMFVSFTTWITSWVIAIILAHSNFILVLCNGQGLSDDYLQIESFCREVIQVKRS